MTSNDISREMVEQHLDDQAEMLSAIRTLIEDRVAFTEWSAWEQAALIAALRPPEGASEFEVIKARNLARHLFRDDIDQTVAFDPECMRPDLADRVRADLSGLVKLGSGTYLKQDVAMLQAATDPAPMSL